nr:extracellular solute-binding protein [Nocardioides luti]
MLGRDFDGFRRAVAAHGDAWADGSVEATWLGLPELQAAVLGPVAAGAAAADLLVVPADWLPALAAAGTIRPLTGLLVDRPPHDWPDAWPASFREGVTWGGSVWGVPFHDGPQLLFTHDAAFADAGLAAPATWSDLLAAAVSLHGPDRAGTVLAGAPDGHNNVYDFVLHLWRCGGDLLDGRSVVLDSPAAREALALLRGLATGLVPDDAHALDSNGSGAAFAEGRVAVTVNWAGYAALAAAGPVAGSGFTTRVAPTHDDGTPTTTVNAFWATAVTSACADPDRAWSYVRHAAGPEMDLATTAAGASGARRSTWTDPTVLAEHPEYALFEAAHAHSRPLPRIPELPTVVDLLNDLVEAVVWQGADADAALARAGRELELVLGDAVTRGASGSRS